MIEPKHLVFVYGTLKKGYGNHSLIGDGEFWGEAITEDSSFALTSVSPYGGFPLVREGDKKVKGEVYLVSNKVLKRLDQLEGVPTMYLRKTTKVLIYQPSFENPIQVNYYHWNGMNEGYPSCISEKGGVLSWNSHKDGR